MLSTHILYSLLFSLAVVASPAPKQRNAVYTLHENKPRHTFAERAAAHGLTLQQLLSLDAKNVLAKYQHNNAVAQKNQGSQSSKRQTSTIPLNDVQSDGVDELYYGTLSLGTPSQQITFDFDTGSSDLWTPTDVSDGVNDGTHFNTLASKTFKDTLKPFDDLYGSGACVGTVATDTVSFGDLTVATQYFGAVNVVSTDFDNDPATGLCGLAYESISSIGQPPLPLNLYQTGQISKPEFGFRITRGTSTGAELTMGGVSADYAGATFQQTPVTVQTYYEVQTNGATVANKTVTGTFPAAIDTGTTLIYIPTADATQFYNAIPGSSAGTDGSYNYPCDFQGPVGFNFPGIGNLNFAMADFNIGANGDGTCQGAVQGMNAQDSNGNDFAIIGDVFIKSYYTVFNFGSNYVAFSPAHDYV